MLDRGLTGIGNDNGVVHIEVRRSSGSVGILVIYTCPVSREDNGGILGQLALKSLLG
jgi:hypothetical protein